MNTYHSENPSHRPAFAVAAAALTALSIALAVVLPAQHEPTPARAPAPMAAGTAQARPVEATINPARIEVIGRRTQETALDETAATRAGRKG